jgi:hypothetical protein
LSLGVAAYLTRVRSPNDPQPLNPMITITVAHVACGALVFVTTIVLTLRTYRVLPETVERAKSSSLRPLRLCGKGQRLTAEAQRTQRYAELELGN